MGVTYGKKDIRNKVDCSPASAYAGLLSNHNGEDQHPGQMAEDQEEPLVGQGQGSEDQEEPLEGSGQMAEDQKEQLDGQDEKSNDLIIQPKKLLNPIRISRSHRELHRELRMTHNRNLCAAGKPELQRVLEQRNWKQEMKQRREAEEKSRSPLQQEVIKRSLRLEEVGRWRTYSHLQQ
ncbi:hypothetical protein DPEC_G00199000 [Dallia pectoralis]|uniref:Uncharacterized protein n=1 Tax=Dallia pectoralis TaxID=75939 RepID=A0ACC2G8D6_DALPE|nr:hypothetical protein DPEC_G00199000 [Dallia pectoralis]